MKDIYELALHEATQVDRFTTIKRVPGGWIYEMTYQNGEESYGYNSVFIPFSDEFKTKTSKEKQMHHKLGFLGCSFLIPKHTEWGDKEVSPLKWACLKYNEENMGKYRLEMYKEFIIYWETRDTSGRMCYAKQKVFNLPARLATWAKNYSPEIQTTKKRKLL